MLSLQLLGLRIEIGNTRRGVLGAALGVLDASVRVLRARLGVLDAGLGVAQTRAGVLRARLGLFRARLSVFGAGLDARDARLGGRRTRFGLGAARLRVLRRPDQPRALGFAREQLRVRLRLRGGRFLARRFDLRGQRTALTIGVLRPRLGLLRRLLGATTFGLARLQP